MGTVARTIAQKTKIVKIMFTIIRIAKERLLSVLMTIVLTSAAYVSGLRVQRKESNLHKNVLLFSKTVATSVQLINPRIFFLNHAPILLVVHLFSFHKFTYNIFS
jgi:hypothetical protein